MPETASGRPDCSITSFTRREVNRLSSSEPPVTEPWWRGPWVEVVQRGGPARPGEAPRGEPWRTTRPCSRLSVIRAWIVVPADSVMHGPMAEAGVNDRASRPAAGHGRPDGTGRDGTGRDGTGRDGTGRDGTGRDGTGRHGTGRGRDGTGREGMERDGTGRDGTGRDGTGRDGTGRGETRRDETRRDGTGRNQGPGWD